MKLQRAFFVLLASELVACSTTRVGINYSPPAEMAAAPSSQADVVVGRFSDDRGEPANWLGAIRGGYGNPLKKLESDEPVSDLVGQVFAAGRDAAASGRSGSGRPGRCEAPCAPKITLAPNRRLASPAAGASRAVAGSRDRARRA
jgi:hypothetical protein